MNIKKIVFVFLLITGLVNGVLCEFVFADNNVFQNGIEGNVFASYKKSDGMAMKVCHSIGKLDTKRKVVALTFDDGPGKYTKEILDILRQNNIRATFFFVGQNANDYKSIVRMAYADGHVIANHTYSHADLRKISADEIKSELIRASRAIYNIIDEYPVLFRPPYGACSSKSTRIVCGLGYTTIAWSDMTNDYDVDKTTPRKITNYIVEHAEPGAIIGMHDGGGNREKTVEALSLVIEELRSQGYQFLTIPELLGIDAYRD